MLNHKALDYINSPSASASPPSASAWLVKITYTPVASLITELQTPPESNTSTRTMAQGLQ